MPNVLQNMAGMGNMTEQVIASDLLLASKNAIKSYAGAIAETTTPEVCDVLRKQLNDAIDSHEQVASFMVSRGYYNAYDPRDQFDMDRKASETVMQLGQQ